MSDLDLLLIVALAAIGVALLVGRARIGGGLMTLVYLAQLALLFRMAPGAVHPGSFGFEIFGQPVGWQLDGLGWFFALMTIGAAVFSTWFASGAWGAQFRAEGGGLRLFHVALAANVFAMLVLLSAGDLLALFIGWELVSWAGLLLMVLGGPKSVDAGIRYITYAMGGGMAILGGLILVVTWTGSVSYAALAAAVPAMSAAQLWTLVALFGIGFSVKMGLLPFHLWQARAYALTAAPAAAFLGAISSRMGLFGIALVLVKLVGLADIDRLAIWPGVFDARDLLLWVAAFTIIFPTFTALKQNDARLLLAWHGIGQGGYMMMGLLLGDAVGSGGGLLHVFNYGANQAALFMAVFAVMYRTGTADLNRLGGLVVRMPLSFLTLLVGIIGLAGLPPMNGFVSKWMVYRALVNEGMPLLFIAAVLGTFGTILSVYKLIHNMFLGQLRIEHEKVSEAPWSMTIPMLLLCVVIMATGMMPGLVLEYVAAAQRVVGLPEVPYILGGVASAQGTLDMLWISGILFSGFAIGAILFYGAGKSRRVHQLDNYAGGHFLTADVRYQYSDNFYAGLMHRIGPLYRGSFQWLENALVSGVESAGMATQGFFRQVQPAAWVLVGATVALIWVVL